MIHQITIHWPDGEEISHDNFDDIFDVLRRSQLQDWEPEAFKQELARRTEVWTGKRIGWVGSPEDILRRMAEVNAIQIVEEDVPETPSEAISEHFTSFSEQRKE